MSFRIALTTAGVALVCLSLAQDASSAQPERERPALEVGSTPINDLGKDVDGNQVHVTDHQGKVVIISFWASWCEPCKKELPVLAGVVKRVGPEHLKVIAINFEDDAKRFKYVVDALKVLPITMLRDAKGTAARKFRVNAIPRMIVIDRDGKVAADHTGYSESALPEFIDELNALLRSQAT
jgi:thiol-disulfide isomerase/thioredoxin